MRNEEKFIQDVLKNTLEGHIQWARVAFKDDAPYSNGYIATHGINPDFRVFIVQNKSENNPFSFIVLLKNRVNLFMTSGMLENAFTLSALYDAAANGGKPSNPDDYLTS